MWSGKLGARGTRFQFLIDARCAIRKVWGWYSPKYFDGHFLRDHRKWFEKHLHHDRIAADNHYSWGRTHLSHPVVYATYKRKKKGDDGTLPQKKRDYNRALSAIRGRIEGVFGQLTTRWFALSHPFEESEEEHEHLVKFAAYLHNEQL
jgi:hypothetical protein